MLSREKTHCKTVKRAYLEDGGIESLTIFSIYPDTAILKGAGGWEPSAEKNTLEFVVPFEQGKSDYKQEDIGPLLEALNEPEYTIDDVFIDAHSSLEGDSTINANLQRKRAESIIGAISVYKGTELEVKEDNITTSLRLGEIPGADSQQRQR